METRHGEQVDLNGDSFSPLVFLSNFFSLFSAIVWGQPGYWDARTHKKPFHATSFASRDFRSQSSPRWSVCAVKGTSSRRSSQPSTLYWTDFSSGLWTGPLLQVKEQWSGIPTWRLRKRRCWKVIHCAGSLLQTRTRVRTLRWLLGAFIKSAGFAPAPRRPEDDRQHKYGPSILTHNKSKSINKWTTGTVSGHHCVTACGESQRGRGSRTGRGV